MVVNLLNNSEVSYTVYLQKFSSFPFHIIQAALVSLCGDETVASGFLLSTETL